MKLSVSIKLRNSHENYTRKKIWGCLWNIISQKETEIKFHERRNLIAVWWADGHVIYWTKYASNILLSSTEIFSLNSSSLVFDWKLVAGNYKFDWIRWLITQLSRCNLRLWNLVRRLAVHIILCNLLVTVTYIFSQIQRIF